MPNPICEFCKVNESIGFVQYFYKDTGEVLEDRLGPNVCEACAETLCDDGDETPKN